LLIFAYFIISLAFVGADINSNCDGDNWIAYGNEKCFKLVKNHVSRDQAEEVCNKLGLVTDASVPTLASIHSPDEYEFLTKHVFNSSDSNIWIGAKRQLNCEKFEWNDGSVLEDFTNWAEGSPTGEPEKGCVYIQTVDSNDMKWKDVSCTKENLVLCQKLPHWSNKDLQQYVLELKSITKQLTTQLNEVKDKLEVVQQNPVPIGFIYVQLPNQREPLDVWGYTMIWREITQDYAGLFFRVVGGGSQPFGITQEQSSPTLSQVMLTGMNRAFDSISIQPNGAWTNAVTSGAVGANIGGLIWGLSFRTAPAEVRPRNSAIRIWIRVA